MVPLKLPPGGPAPPSPRRVTDNPVLPISALAIIREHADEN